MPIYVSFFLFSSRVIGAWYTSPSVWHFSRLVGRSLSCGSCSSWILVDWSGLGPVHMERVVPAR